MLASATIIGRAHRLRQQNSHDFAITHTTQNGITIGLVLDGCGSKFKQGKQSYPSQNEVGAKLLGTFVMRHLAAELNKSQDISATIDSLYPAALSFLHNILNLYSFDDMQKQQFVYTNLLCTMVGFVLKEDTAVFFWRGDGWLIHNDTLIDLDTNNHPDYLAYDLLNTPKGLQTKSIPSSAIACIGVATDGWSEQLLNELAPQKNDIMLQRWVNSQAKHAPNFEDDASIAIYWNELSVRDEARGSKGVHAPQPLISPAPNPQPPTS